MAIDGDVLDEVHHQVLSSFVLLARNELTTLGTKFRAANCGAGCAVHLAFVVVLDGCSRACNAGKAPASEARGAASQVAISVNNQTVQNRSRRPTMRRKQNSWSRHFGSREFANAARQSRGLRDTLRPDSVRSRTIYCPRMFICLLLSTHDTLRACGMCDGHAVEWAAGVVCQLPPKTLQCINDL
jgi:hypothetical protein